MESTAPNMKLLWAGRVISGLGALLLLMGGVMKIMRLPAVIAGFAQFGYPESVILTIGLLEVGSAVLYLIPRTAALGAILVAAFLGGATATHVRMGDPWFAPVIVGVLMWIGLYLREPRLRELVPLRRM